LKGGSYDFHIETPTNAGSLDREAIVISCAAIRACIDPIGSIDTHFVAVVSRLTLALARDVVAAGSVVAVAALRAVLAPATLRASIRAHRTLRRITYALLGVDVQINILLLISSRMPPPELTSQSAVR